MSSAAATAGIRPIVVELVALTKPRVTSLVLATAAVGIGMAPDRLALGSALITLLATLVLVGSANALNCWLERDTDAFMTRTRTRPLPARRLEAPLALAFGVALAAISLPVLFLAVNTVTGLLGVVALVSYVALYTPLKYVAPSAALVGAIPGALPPLMGWTAATGELGAGGVLLFAVVFLWQLPHVIGLSTYRRDEYTAAGIKVLPAVRGPRIARLHAIAWAATLFPVVWALYALGLSGGYYLAVGLALTAFYFAAAVRPPPPASEGGHDRWGRRLFLASLLYLPLLFTALMLDMR